MQFMSIACQLYKSSFMNFIGWGCKGGTPLAIVKNLKSHVLRKVR